MYVVGEMDWSVKDQMPFPTPSEVAAYLEPSKPSVIVATRAVVGKMIVEATNKSSAPE